MLAKVPLTVLSFADEPFFSDTFVFPHSECPMTDNDRKNRTRTSRRGVMAAGLGLSAALVSATGPGRDCQARDPDPAVSNDGVAARSVAVSVRDFGAKGDGKTDDTAAIQAAFDSPHPRIYFPPGTYLATRTILIRRESTLAFGERWASIIRSSVQTGPLFDVHYAYDNLQHGKLNLERLCFQCDGTPPAGHAAVRLRNVRQPIIRECQFSGFGIHLNPLPEQGDGCYYGRVVDNVFDGGADTWALHGEDAKHWIIENNIFQVSADLRGFPYARVLNNDWTAIKRGIACGSGQTWEHNRFEGFNQPHQEATFDWLTIPDETVFRRNSYFLDGPSFSDFWNDRRVVWKFLGKGSRVENELFGSFTYASLFDTASATGINEISFSPKPAFFGNPNSIPLGYGISGRETRILIDRESGRTVALTVGGGWHVVSGTVSPNENLLQARFDQDISDLAASRRLTTSKSELTIAPPPGRQSRAFATWHNSNADDALTLTISGDDARFELTPNRAYSVVYAIQIPAGSASRQIASLTIPYRHQGATYESRVDLTGRDEWVVVTHAILGDPHQTPFEFVLKISGIRPGAAVHVGELTLCEGTAPPPFSSRPLVFPNRKPPAPAPSQQHRQPE
jgi:hypothetical protein